MKLSELIGRVVDFFYVKPIARVVPRQTFRYGACGAANMALDLLLYYVVFHYVVGQSNVTIGLLSAGGPWSITISPHIAALGIVFPITLFNGFWLNRNVAFRHSPLRHTTQALRYLLSVGGSLALNYVFMKLFVEVCHIYPTPSKALTTCVTVVYSYLMQKYFTFRGSADL